MPRAGSAVMFYPFILMDQMPGNGAARPLERGAEQPALPWRGRITLSRGAGAGRLARRHRGGRGRGARPSSARRGRGFRAVGRAVTYAGPEEWALSALHPALCGLCAAAGGVEAFCIGSEMRGADADPRGRRLSGGRRG